MNSYRQLPGRVRRILHSCLLYATAGLIVGVVFLAFPFRTELKFGDMVISSTAVAYGALALLAVSGLGALLIIKRTKSAFVVLIAQGAAIIGSVIGVVVVLLSKTSISQYPISATFLVIILFGFVLQAIADLRLVVSAEVRQYLA